MNRFAAACGAVFVALAVCGAARAEFRHALVIGNSAYEGEALSSPERDAKAVGEALRKRGFAVTEAVNLGVEAMREAVANFAIAVPTRGTALVYFAGYCLPTPRGPQPAPNQDTVLLAVDHGDLAKPWQFSSYGMTARQVLTQLATEFREKPVPGKQVLRRQGGSLTNVLILDGCYQLSGLKPEMPRGLLQSGTLAPESLTIYAAAFGETLEPAQEGLSPFAQQLVSELETLKPLDEVLATVGGGRESSLGDLSRLAEPASQSVSSPNEVQAGGKAGDEWVNGLGMVFCWCPPGSFTIGTGPPDSRQSPWDEQHDEILADIEFPQGFWIGKYECTLRDMRAAMTATHRSVGNHKLIPMNRVSFRMYDWRRDFEGMIEKLNETVPEGWGYDMPTEAEWEYAARAGSQTAYAFGDDPAELSRHGNFADRTLRESATKGEAGDRSLIQTPPHYTGLFSYAHDSWADGHATLAVVGSYPPNAWGLHDVHGNVAEVTSTPYQPARVPLPIYAGEKAPREAVTKGGSWLSVASYCRSAHRGRLVCEEEQHEGLRLVLRKKGAASPRVEPTWTPLVPTRFTSTAAAEAAIAADGTVFVTGKPLKDTYVLEAVVPNGIAPRAIRLEVLADPNLPASGPGRAGNGTFQLGEFSVRFGPPGSSEAPTPTTFLHALADYEYTYGRSAGAIDGKPETFWSTMGSAGKDHAALFLVRLPARNGEDGAEWRHPSASSRDAMFAASGAPLVITLDHPSAATLGKFRLSVTEDDVAP